MCVWQSSSLSSPEPLSVDSLPDSSSLDSFFCLVNFFFIGFAHSASESASTAEKISSMTVSVVCEIPSESQTRKSRIACTHSRNCEEGCRIIVKKLNHGHWKMMNVDLQGQARLPISKNNLCKSSTVAWQHCLCTCRTHAVLSKKIYT